MRMVGKEWAAGACLVVALAGLSACQVTTRQKAASLAPIAVPAFEETKPIAFNSDQQRHTAVWHPCTNALAHSTL